MAAFAALATVLSSCGGWRARADDLRQSADALAVGGHARKDDFARQFGTPTSCVPLPTGELCRWRTEFSAARSEPRETEVLRVQFDRAGNFVSDAAVGERIYHGRSSPAAPTGPGSTFGDCPPGQLFENGSCSALDPIQGEKGLQ
jgi:hypothetical protein